jgi:hypothetical protein
MPCRPPAPPVSASSRRSPGLPRTALTKAVIARPRSNRWVRPLADPRLFWSLSDGNREALRGLSQGTGAIGGVGELQFEPRRREVDKGVQLSGSSRSPG